jgi:hypothetical protein
MSLNELVNYNFKTVNAMPWSIMMKLPSPISSIKMPSVWCLRHVRACLNVLEDLTDKKL